MTIIPPQYRLMLGTAALIVAAAGGAVVNGWRLDGAHERSLAEKDRQIATLRTAISDQNHAVEAMGAAKVAADGRRQLAAKLAAGAIAQAGARGAAAAASKATDCDGVMREAWGSWQ